MGRMGASALGRQKPGSTVGPGSFLRRCLSRALPTASFAALHAVLASGLRFSTARLTRGYTRNCAMAASWVCCTLRSTYQMATFAACPHLTYMGHSSLGAVLHRASSAVHTASKLHTAEMLAHCKLSPQDVRCRSCLCRASDAANSDLTQVGASSRGSAWHTASSAYQTASKLHTLAPLLSDGCLCSVS